MSVDFRNPTPFPALAFEGIDQFDQAFHVIVLRQTLTWGTEGTLVYADEQAPLCEVDEYFGALNASSIRQESDLCHYKPRCDVIVNATAYAPIGQSTRRFQVRCVLRRPDVSLPLPERPQGLNQFVEADEASLREWRAQVAYIRQNPTPGQRLIDKALTVTGERTLMRRVWPLRLFATIVHVSTLGLLSPPTWRLTRPAPFTSLPLRYEYAYGGECRIHQDDPCAKRVPQKNRLAKDLPSNNQDGPHRPIALDAFEGNAVGRGFTQNWYVRATRARRLPAPRIEPANAPFTSARFEKLQQASYRSRSDFPALAAGLGVRPKVHPERRKLAGTIDRKFMESDAWLPEDFDFAVWNAAPADQQTEFLRGDESIELTNLCEPGSTGASMSSEGNTFLKLQLPGHTCTLLMRMQNGTMFFHAMHIDTLIVEPATRTVSVVWRAVFEKSAEIRAVDARLHREFEADFTQQLNDVLTRMPAEALRRAALDSQPEEDHGHDWSTQEQHTEGNFNSAFVQQNAGRGQHAANPVSDGPGPLQ